MSAALNAIFVQGRHSLLWTVMRIVRDAQTAEDVVQESYVRVRKALELGRIDHIEAFLHQTAKNLALDHIRRSRTRARFEGTLVDERDIAEIPADVPSLEDQLIHRDRLRKLDEALSSLPERARQVWVLSKLEGWPYGRIAAHLGVSENTVFGDMKRAMIHCMKALERLEQD